MQCFIILVVAGLIAAMADPEVSDKTGEKGDSEAEDTFIVTRDGLRFFPDPSGRERKAPMPRLISNNFLGSGEFDNYDDDKELIKSRPLFVSDGPVLKNGNFRFNGLQNLPNFTPFRQNLQPNFPNSIPFRQNLQPNFPNSIPFRQNLQLGFLNQNFQNLHQLYPFNFQQNTPFDVPNLNRNLGFNYLG